MEATPRYFAAFRRPRTRVSKNLPLLQYSHPLSFLPLSLISPPNHDTAQAPYTPSEKSKPRSSHMSPNTTSSITSSNDTSTSVLMRFSQLRCTALQTPRAQSPFLNSRSVMMLSTPCAVVCNPGTASRLVAMNLLPKRVHCALLP